MQPLKKYIMVVKKIIEKVFPKVYARIYDEGYLASERDKKEKPLTKTQKDWYHYQEERKKEICLRES